VQPVQIDEAIGKLDDVLRWIASAI